MTCHGVFDHARGFHFLDKSAQKSRGGRSLCFRYAHRLVDHHKTLTQNANARHALRIGLKLLFHTGGDFKMLRQKVLHDRLRGRGAYDRGLFEMASQK
jgi:hypothetical protein